MPCSTAAVQWLDPDRPVAVPRAEPPVGRPRHVAGGVDARGSAAQRRIADHAVVDLQARTLQPRRVRHDPDAHDHQISGDAAAVRHGDCFDLVGSQHAFHPDAKAQLDAVLSVQRADARAHLDTQPRAPTGPGPLR